MLPMPTRPPFFNGLLADDHLPVPPRPRGPTLVPTWRHQGFPSPTADLAIDGAATLKAALIPIVLHYATADPLG